MRSGVQRFDSRDPPSCGVPNESDWGHGLGNPLRCSKGKREIHAATCGSGGWPGPHYFFAVLPCPKINHTEHRVPQRKTTEEQLRPTTTCLCGFLCVCLCSLC